MKLALLFPIAIAPLALAQGPPGRGGQPPRTARAAAPVDLTGNWVSVISEDWRWRMTTPLKGDFASIPVTPQARKDGEAWDPAKDEAAGLQCKSYGAAAIMRVPGRARISWQDDNTLKVELDAGTQTRLFHFGGQAPQGTAPSWQGYSAANWERPMEGVERPDPFPIFARRTANEGRALEVVTTSLRAGYLRKNGVPYDEKTVVNEYYDYHKEPNGDEWFTVTTVVRDPAYLTGPFITSSDFKKERDGSKWNPGPCSSR